jgi:hypothetical protein
VEPLRARSRTAGLVVVVLAALTMGLTFAHTLGLPQRLGYDAARWTRIQHSLYRYFGVIGGPVEVAAVIAAVVVFALCARGRPAGRLATVGAASLIVVLAVWFPVVNTANARGPPGRSAPYRRTGDAGEPSGSSGTPGTSC